MTFTELVAAVYNRLGVPSGDAFLTTDVVGAFVNEALLEIDTEEVWPWNQKTETITTTAGDGSYAPAADWELTRTLRIDDDVPMDRLSLAELNGRYPDLTQTGRPTSFTVEGEEILVRPIPDAAYSLEHRYLACEVAISGSQTPIMPVRFHQAIVSLATHIALGRSREDGRSQAALAAYNRQLGKMRRYRRRYTGPARIRTRLW